MTDPIPFPRTGEDRWNKAKMARFLRELAATHSVSEAARAVGMSRQSAYRLRARLKGQPFDVAWEAAFQHGYDELAQAALERALHGVEVPIYCKGELIGTRRHFDERLTCYLLGARNRAGAQRLGRYNAASEYWSESWDRMIERIEHGPVEWQQAAPEELEEEQEMGMSEEELSAHARRRNEEDRLKEQLLARHAPDPLPKSMRDK